MKIKKIAAICNQEGVCVWALLPGGNLGGVLERHKEKRLHYVEEVAEEGGAK